MYDDNDAFAKAKKGSIKELEIERCLKLALSLDAIKLQNVGRLPKNHNLMTKGLRIT